MKHLKYLAVIGCLWVLSVGCYANEAMLHRSNVQQFIQEMVKKQGFKQSELTKTIQQAQYRPKIIAAMERPYEKKTWDIYQRIFLTSERVQKGLKFWRENQETLNAIQKKYGVPANVIVAIIGVETLYGEQQGKYRVLDALSTLAFYYPKRSKFFTKELKEYLLLCREHDVSPTKYVGSYAGAIGKPQFMPSSYRFYAVDFSGNGRRDLIEDNGDVIASVANYFHKHGWHYGGMVAQSADVKGTKYKKLKKNTRRANYAYPKLVQAGVKPTRPDKRHPEKAGLIELDLPKKHEYWIAYPNFYVITRYNTSPQYALVVYLLSQKLEKQWVTAQLLGKRAYA